MVTAEGVAAGDLEELGGQGRLVDDFIWSVGKGSRKDYQLVLTIELSLGVDDKVQHF